MATPPTNATSVSSQASSSGKPALPPGMVLGPDGKPCKICTAFRNWKPGTMSNTEADSNRDKQQSSRTPNASASGSGSKQKAGSGFSAGFTGFASLAAGAGASTSTSASSSTTTTTESKKDGEGERDDMSYRGNEIPPDCPPDVEVLGRSTWTFLHTAAAYFPDKPTPAQRASMISLLRSLPVIYPCGWCAQDFGEDLAQNPPDVSNGKKLSEWLCQRHNQVNEKLGKPLFDCLKVDERWKDGPADGRFILHPHGTVLTSIFQVLILATHDDHVGDSSMLPAPVTGANRRSANLVISIPHTREASVYRPHFKPSGKLLYRYLPWLVGFTILLWLFVLRGDSPPTSRTGPLRGHHPHMPQPGKQGLSYSTRPAPMRGAAPPPSDPEKKVVKWNWPVVGKITGKKKDAAKEHLKPVTQTLWDRRAEKVKDAFVHAFEGYTRHAAGYDELLPIVGGSVNNFNGWGVTVFDSLDTMWIMGLRDMFKDSLALVAKADFDTKPGKYAPFFETIIRYLGGLLSAYALSGEPLLLTRADDLGRALLPGFESPSGLPMFAVNTKNGDTKKGWSGDILWSEALSNQMEFKYLAHITGRKEYFTKTDEIMQKMYNATLPNGLFPSKWHYETGTPANEHYSVGAYADSAYEYMLKQWLLSGRSEPQALELYMNSANAILEKMLYITPTRNLLYVTDLNADTPTHTLEHLSCFLPGLLALGVHTLTDDLIPKKTRERHLWAAEGLAETCWITYADTETGLGPDEMRMKPWPPKTASTTTTEKRDGLWGFGAREDEDVGGKWMAHVRKWERGGRVGGKPPGARTVPKESDPGKRDWSPAKTAYLLRPETIESFYILWKVTGDAKWRDRGWAVFESIDRHARTKYGYASVSNVDVVPPQWKDEMPSYFLAETLKYLYLLFVEEDLIPFEYWVFNTEAHPLPIFNWTSWETEAYGIHTDLSTAS